MWIRKTIWATPVRRINSKSPERNKLIFKNHHQTVPPNRKKPRKVTRVGTFEVSVPTHVALRMFIMQVLASQLHFLANRNAGLAIPPLLWPVNCIKIGGHVVLLSDPTVYSLYCDYI